MGGRGKKRLLYAVSFEDFFGEDFVDFPLVADWLLAFSVGVDVVVAAMP